MTNPEAPISPALPDGLTAQQVAESLHRFGPNLVAEARPRGAATFLRKFWGVIPGMLELAVILDLALGRWIEAAVIVALLVFNAVIGFSQENRAQRAVALLRQRLTVNARVRRDGHWQVVPASEIVPDDLVHLRVGDVVPADIRLTDGQILVDQSQLTGESLPLEQGPGATVYSGSAVRRGEATGAVSATGSRTLFGKTAELVRLAESPRRLQLLIVGIAKYLAALDVVLGIAVVAAVVIRGMPLLDTLPLMLMLLVAAVPVALPAMFTMSSTLGARGLAENGILVTRLSAIEDAAAMDVLCLDKTGTLTENRLAVAHLAPRAPMTHDDLLRLAALASDDATQDPIDLAFLHAARMQALLASPPPRLSFEPFDPSIKRSEVSVRQGDEVMRILKGEPATVAELARVPWPEIRDDVARLSADGSRVLAVATGAGASLQLAGLIALSDPPRADSAALIADLKDRGVRVLLVTGDGEATARAVAARVGIAGEVAPEGTIREELDPEVAVRFSIFPRVFPKDKFLLVQALQRAGHIVGMTGDGVNDAPALRQADVGVAVASATDVAKAAASLVLTRPGLGEIVMAVDGSRRIYQRMRTFILTMNTRKISIPTFIALGIVLFGALVLNPLLMVLLLFTTDAVTMSVSTDRVTPSAIPDRWAARPLMVTSLGLAVLLFLSSSAVFWVAANLLRLGVAETQTLIFVWLVFAGSQAVLYLNRGRGFFWAKPYPGRSLVLATLLDLLVVGVLATQGWLMTPIPPYLFAGIFILSLVFLVLAGWLKVALTQLAVPGDDVALGSHHREVTV